MENITRELAEVLRMGADLKQPVFAGGIAFDICTQGHNIFCDYSTGIKYTVVGNTKVYECLTLADLVFFTCELWAFPALHLEAGRVQ